MSLPAHDHHDHGPAEAHHGHGHHHHHGPGHAHVHAPASFGRAFAVGITLNTVFVIIEAAYGYASNSVALIADAGHNLSDVLGLIVAWVAVVLSKRAPTSRFTYGWRASSILAALLNAMFLLLAIGAIGWESILRLFHPEPVVERTVIVVALIGILINGLTAYLFASGSKGDINIRGAYLHMAADAAVSAGVVVAGLVIMATGWIWLDPAVSLVIVAVILVGTWGLLRDGVVLSLAAVPPGIDPASVERFLKAQPGVTHLHDLHIWPMSTTDVALTAHLVMPDGHPGDAMLIATAEELRAHYGIGHVTLQIEQDGSACPLAPAHVI